MWYRAYRTTHLRQAREHSSPHDLPHRRCAARRHLRDTDNRCLALMVQTHLLTDLGPSPGRLGDTFSLFGYDPIANLVEAKGLFCASREAPVRLFLSRRSRHVACPGAAKGGDAIAQICSLSVDVSAGYCRTSSRPITNSGRANTQRRIYHVEEAINSCARDAAGCEYVSLSRRSRGSRS